MDYQTKLQFAHKELNDKGVWKSNYNPPIAKLLCKIGLNFPPPYYQTFMNNWIISAITFAPVWGVLNWFIVWSHADKPVLEAVYMSLIGGVLFGLIMATFYFVRRKQLNLSEWGSLGE